MERIQEGQPFSMIIDCTDSPARLEKLFRHIRKMIPEGGRIFGVVYQSHRKKVLERKLAQISSRYCHSIYYAPCDSSDECRQEIIENACRQADFCDCILILGNQNCTAAREAARQVAYELGSLY